MSLVEILVAASIILGSVVSIVGVFGGLTSLSLNNTPRVQAAMLLDEGGEALRLMRDSGWAANIASLTDGVTYRFIWQNSSWKATTSVVMIDDFFDRTFVLSAVNRDATTHDIQVSTSTGVLDTGTRKATVTVSWREPTATTSKSVQTYLFNAFNN